MPTTDSHEKKLRRELARQGLCVIPAEKYWGHGFHDYRPKPAMMNGDPERPGCQICPYTREHQIHTMHRD